MKWRPETGPWAWAGTFGGPGSKIYLLLRQTKHAWCHEKSVRAVWNHRIHAETESGPRPGRPSSEKRVRPPLYDAFTQSNTMIASMMVDELRLHAYPVSTQRQPGCVCAAPWIWIDCERCSAAGYNGRVPVHRQEQWSERWRRQARRVRSGLSICGGAGFVGVPMEIAGSIHRLDDDLACLTILTNHGHFENLNPLLD
jgi:hypothetical protein